MIKHAEKSGGDDQQPDRQTKREFYQLRRRKWLSQYQSNAAASQTGRNKNILLAHQQPVSENKTLPEKPQGLRIFLRQTVFPRSNAAGNNGSVDQ